MNSLANGPPKKEGELLKYRNFWSGWKARYFKLERSYLHYFETKHSMNPIGTITRGEIVEVRSCSSFPDKENVFEIVQKSGLLWQVQAASTEDMLAWMKVLSPIPIIVDEAQSTGAASHLQSDFDQSEDNISWPTNEKPPLEQEAHEHSQFSVPYPALPSVNEGGQGVAFNANQTYPQLPGDVGHGHPSAPFFCSPPPPYSETDNTHPSGRPS